jgi:peptide/nickel transport system substrate-binding protein
MSVRQILLAAITASIAAFAPASAQTLRYANQGDLKSLDPYTLRETTTIAHHGHVYEGLVARDKELKIVPGLAESWETPEPTRWRFHLRHDVKFHNGDPFTADDVLFSADRVRAVGSDFATVIPAGAKFVKVDDYTVDVMLASPNPILITQWDGWYIMDKKWCEENNAVAGGEGEETETKEAAPPANRALRYREPSARREDRFQALRRLVAQARA